jgi:nucleotide-binding universal stress UspA family protein
MTEHVLVPFDGSPLSRRALERVLASQPDADVTLLHVVDPVGVIYESETRGLPDGETWFERRRADAEEILAEAVELAADLDPGREVETAIEVGSPARTILAYVDDHDVDHVVMGSHGRSGVSRLVFGSVAEQVMRQSPVAVTVVR